MGKDGRPPFKNLKEIQDKIKDGSMKIVFETDGVTREVICTRCGTTFSPTFFLENPDPKDGFCSVCKSDKYLEWNTGGKKQDS